MTRLLSDTAPGLIRQLGLAPHPEGGHFRETYRDRPAGGGRGRVTAIYYLLEAGHFSAWHRLHGADEVWHHYAGDPLAVHVIDPAGALPRQGAGVRSDPASFPRSDRERLDAAPQPR